MTGGSFFAVTGAVSLVWLLPWLLLLRKWEDAPKSAAAIATAQQSASFRESLLLLKQRSVLGIFLGFFAYDYVWYVYQSWLPSYLVMERKFSKSEMGILTAMPYLAMSVIILIAGVSSDALVRRGYEEKKVRKIFNVIGLLICCLIVPAGLVQTR
jgi:sugar phosphate permease